MCVGGWHGRGGRWPIAGPRLAIGGRLLVGCARRRKPTGRRRRLPQSEPFPLDNRGPSTAPDRLGLPFEACIGGGKPILDAPTSHWDRWLGTIVTAIATTIGAS